MSRNKACQKQLVKNYRLLTETPPTPLDSNLGFAPLPIQVSEIPWNLQESEATHPIRLLSCVVVSLLTVSAQHPAGGWGKDLLKRLLPLPALLLTLLLSRFTCPPEDELLHQEGHDGPVNVGRARNDSRGT